MTIGSLRRRRRRTHPDMALPGPPLTPGVLVGPRSPATAAAALIATTTPQVMYNRRDQSWSVVFSPWNLAIPAGGVEWPGGGDV